MSALPPLMSLLGTHALPVLNAITHSLKSTEDVADSLNDAVLKLFLIHLLMTFGALSSMRDDSQSAVGGHMWESENIYPSIVGVFETALPRQ